MTTRGAVLRLGTALVAAAGLVIPAAAVAGPASATIATTATRSAATPPLTNLAHLDFLGTTVTPPSQAGHTTYRLSQDPSIGVLWTYADRQPDGTYRRVGGGAYDPATNTYGQGAFNADDVSRAAVVYLRHWKLTGSASSRATAYGLLRGLTYLQTSSGPNAGNVVLWMQPDGTLHPSALPPEQPDPSDSGASYWLARTTWALGEGYAAFVHSDPAFARFLASRLDLAVGALNREVLTRYGSYFNIDGRPTPRWLVVDGGDATAEAVLGLSAYVGAGATNSARAALRELTDGLAVLAGEGNARQWPFDAVMPWALSRSDWHAWASQMPAALARASVALHTRRYARAAAADSAVFDTWLLTSGGPDNGRLPTAIDRTQIAYGVDSRVESLVATAQATGDLGARRLAGLTAAWFFGANAAGVPAYDPSTGRTIDGINADGVVNRNGGAESTIHGLLSMLALDANPDIATIAEEGTITERVGTTTVQAEDATLGGSATAVVPASTWTGESQYGGTGYAALPNGGTVTFTVPASAQAQVLMPVVDLRPDSSARTVFSSTQDRLGPVRSDAIGAQGDSPAPGALLPVTLRHALPAGATTFMATTSAHGSDVAILDAVMLQPIVSRYAIAGGGRATALLRSFDRAVQHTDVTLPGDGRATVEVYDVTGKLRMVSNSDGPTVPVTVLPGGFSIARR